MVNVLFVCLGNICRSPSAEGYFRHLLAESGLDGRVSVDSAGTSAFQVGRPPDPRAVAAAARRSIDISRLRARRVHAADFERFDYLLAMDGGNLASLACECPPQARDRLHLLLAFAPHLSVRDVPDPYGGGPEGFEYMLDLIEAGSAGFLDHLRRTHFA